MCVCVCVCVCVRERERERERDELYKYNYVGFHRKTPRIVGHVLSKRAIIIVS